MTANRITPALVGALVDAAHAYAVGWLDPTRIPAGPLTAGSLRDCWTTIADLGLDRAGQMLTTTAHAAALADGTTNDPCEPFYVHHARPLATPVQIIRWTRHYQLCASSAPSWGSTAGALDLTDALIECATVRLDGYDTAGWPDDTTP